MHFVIMGSGAVGGYFGARLSQAGEKVTFVARNKQYQAMKEKGLKIESVFGDVQLLQINVVDNLSEVKAADVILIAVKSFQLSEAIAQLKPIINKTTRIIPLLNGVNSIAELQSASIADENILGGLAKIISQVKAPGIISHTGTKPHITLGYIQPIDENKMTDDKNSPQEIAEVFLAAGISVGVTKNINTALWRKFIFVAAWGALASVVRVPVGALRSNSSSLLLLENIINEYAQLANAENISITEKMISETVRFIEALPANSETSMQRDIESGVMSEFKALVEYPKQLSQKHSIETPTLDFCHACLSARLDNI